MAGTPDAAASAFAEIAAVARDYPHGMVYADEAQPRRAFHPKCLMVGLYNGRHEFDAIDTFIAFVIKTGGLKRGTPYYNEIVAIDVTGDIAMLKLTDDFLGERYTDYLTLHRENGRWLIVHKAFYVHPAA